VLQSERAHTHTHSRTHLLVVDLEVSNLGNKRRVWFLDELLRSTVKDPGANSWDETHLPIPHHRVGFARAGLAYGWHSDGDNTTRLSTCVGARRTHNLDKKERPSNARQGKGNVRDCQWREQQSTRRNRNEAGAAGRTHRTQTHRRCNHQSMT
jgi:hypothetical protein